ncbi:hypothetical protein F5Y09DRAFT_347111 [Xylaria sp. FL1042]|nr:hypothetical protein F5Y09DRAFT_347111 [Xylaria sp. FL1042]
MNFLGSIFAHELENISHSESFTYGVSRLGLNEVRILVLLPQDYIEGSADVHCQLIRLELNATEQHGLIRHPFIALSYVWGDPGQQKEIFINGKSKLVTSNLYDALIHIRGLLSPVSLFLDDLLRAQGRKVYGLLGFVDLGDDTIRPAYKKPSYDRIKQISDDEPGTAFHNDIQSLLLDTRHHTATDFDACGGLEKRVSISPKGKQLSVRGIEFDTVEEILHYQDEMGVDKRELWVDAVKSMWDQGRMRNVYDNINTLSHVCTRTAAYGHKESRLNLGPQMQAFEDVEIIERPEAIMTRDGISPCAFEPFDSDEKSSETTEEEEE